VSRLSTPSSATAHSPVARGLADVCAIDFGTSNSAVALPTGVPVDGSDVEPGGIRLVPLEGPATTMPTAVFYFVEGSEHDGPPRAFGRAAIAAYVDGQDGRLMRSMKSILGSTLADQRTDVGGGRAVGYLDVIAGYLRHLKRRAEAVTGQPVERAVIGRPVRFVDDDDERDRRAQAALAEAARRIGFTEVRFQFEPIAAAFDHEQRIAHEERVLVADIGGGTSDFCVVRVGPDRRHRLERADDILAHHGVHIAGTDFDRHLELATVLRTCGYAAFGPASADGPPREVPSRVYFDLATWHLINTVYAPLRVAELRGMKRFYGDPSHHRRLMTVVDERLGHDLAARAEAAKIALADARPGQAVPIDLSLVERGLAASLSDAQCEEALAADLARIVDAADETLRRAGIAGDSIDALYFTGGSTGLARLTAALQARFPAARAVHGERFASVATGLGVTRWFA
jgi:hypothetical chaperone protein